MGRQSMLIDQGFGWGPSFCSRSIYQLSRHLARHHGVRHHITAGDRVFSQRRSRKGTTRPHVYGDHGDPHRAALEDAQPDAKVSESTWAAVLFLVFTLQSSLSFALLTVFPILVPIALELQHNTKNVKWMASGWSLAASISINIAGQLSDYFGRRYSLLFGLGLLILDHTVGATAQDRIALSGRAGSGGGSCSCAERHMSKGKWLY
ncbi:hypothetical protein CLAIMM_12428 [Cladophialophora immunda]|nr:hypothetical protein CLAIMM_12428 [Cladophialophora immunda]